MFRVVPLSTEAADEVRRTRRAPGYGHPVHQDLAKGYGPCRHCLRTFRKGEEDRLLFTHNPFAKGLLPSPGPVFIHADACGPYRGDAFPSDLRTLPLVLEGYDRGGAPVGRIPVDGDVETAIASIFSRAEVAFAHVRNAEVGCFMARLERA